MSKIPVKIESLLKKYTVDEIIKAVKVNHNRIMYQRSMKKPIYTKKKVENIINKYDKKYNKKTLVICHGKVHHKKFKDALLLNRLNNTKYRHLDLHDNNIMWSNKLNDFRIIDWGVYETITNKKIGQRGQFIKLLKNFCCGCN